MNSTTENGRSVLDVVPGGDRISDFIKLKAGPAEVLLRAGHAPARGRVLAVEVSVCRGG